MTYFNSLQTPRLSIVGPIAAAAFKWGAHAPGVQLFEANTSAKYLGSAVAAALGTAPFIVGTNTATWEIRINIPGAYIVGIATATRDLGSAAPGPDALFHQIVAAAEGTIINVALTPATLTTSAVTPPTPAIPPPAPPTAAVSSFVAPYAALTMYPFIAAAGPFAATFATSSGATFTTNAASELTITSAATPIRIFTGDTGLFVDGKAVATTTGAAAVDINGVIIGAAPRRIEFAPGGPGIIQMESGAVDALRIQSDTTAFMRFDNFIGNTSTNILTPLNMNGQPLLSVAPSDDDFSFYRRIPAATYALMGNIIPDPGPAIEMAISLTRIGAVTTMDWGESTPFNGTGDPGNISAPTFAIPIGMRPFIDRFIPIAIINNGANATGRLSVNAASGEITFTGPDGGPFTGVAAISIFAGAATWTTS